MPYHVRITQNSEKNKNIIELDMSKDNLIKNITKPFETGEKFMCDGEIIDPFDIKNITLCKTKKSSKKRSPIIDKKRSKIGKNASSILTSEHKLDIIKKGKIVTRDFIKKIPKTEKLEKQDETTIDDNQLKIITIIIMIYLGLPTLLPEYHLFNYGIIKITSIILIALWFITTIALSFIINKKFLNVPKKIYYYLVTYSNIITTIWFTFIIVSYGSYLIGNTIFYIIIAGLVVWIFWIFKNQ